MSIEVPSSNNDKILQDIMSIYEENELGLKNISKDKWIKAKIFSPTKKISILLVGTHSSGKSSFTNWFFGDNIQTVSKSIETEGFTFITTGKQKKTLGPEATINFFDYLKDISKINSFLDNLSTQIIPQYEERSSLVTIIDTPGLVDDRPSSVESILELCNHVQLIFCFFDPITQAFCKKLQNFLFKVIEKHKSKMFYFLSKADTLNETERTSILSSITQSISQCVKEQNIKIRLLSIPGFGFIKKDIKNELNFSNFDLEWICQKISDTVIYNVQQSIVKLGEDNSTITKLAEISLSKMKKFNRVFYFFFSLLILIISYILSALKNENIYFFPYLYQIFLIFLIINLFLYFFKPSKNNIKKLQSFLDGPSRIAKTRINEFYEKLKSEIQD